MAEKTGVPGPGSLRKDGELKEEDALGGPSKAEEKKPAARDEDVEEFPDPDEDDLDDLDGEPTKHDEEGVRWLT
jgi:hypothetical protein